MLESKKKTADAAGKAYENLLNKKDAAQVDVATALTSLEKAITSYNDQVTEDTQTACLAEPKPMLHAMTVGFQDRMVKKVANKDGVWTVEVNVESLKDYIDIVKLNKKQEGLSANNDWMKFINSLQRIVNVAIAKAVKDSNADEKQYTVKKADLYTSADYVGEKLPGLFDQAHLEKDADPFSIGSLTKVIQAYVIMILGEDAPVITRKAARFVTLLAAKDSKLATYKVVNDKNLLKLVQKVVYALLNGLAFEEFKK